MDEGAGVSGLVVATPLRIEARAVRGARLPVLHTGMGAARSRAAAGRLARQREAGRAVAVAGFCAGIADGVRPGDVVVAAELRMPDGRLVPLADSARLVEELRRLAPQLTVHHGRVATVERLVRGPDRARLRAEGVVAADMESGYLLGREPGPWTAVLRVVTDNGGAGVAHPRIVADGVRAYRVLRAAAPALEAWAGLADDMGNGGD